MEKQYNMNNKLKYCKMEKNNYFIKIYQEDK